MLSAPRLLRSHIQEPSELALEALAVFEELLQRSLDADDFPHQRFWHDSLRRAVACRAIARWAGTDDADGAFCLGLIQEGGLVLLAAESDAVIDFLDHPSARRLLEERIRFGSDHSEVLSEHLCDACPELRLGVALHHRDLSPELDRRVARLALFAGAADAVADVAQTGAAGSSLRQARATLKKLPSRNPIGLAALYAQVASELDQAMELLGWAFDPDPELEQLVEQGNPQPLFVSGRYESLTGQLGELVLLSKRRTQSLQEARREQDPGRDPHTGLPTRTRFMRSLGQALDRLGEEGRCFSVLRLRLATEEDLHPVARTLVGALRDSDVVARLDERQLVAMLPDTGPAGLQVVVDRLERCLPGVRIGATCADSPAGLPARSELLARARP
jgi:GGDEF domain-containing protein